MTAAGFPHLLNLWNDSVDISRHFVSWWSSAWASLQASFSLSVGFSQLPILSSASGPLLIQVTDSRLFHHLTSPWKGSLAALGHISMFSYVVESCTPPHSSCCVKSYLWQCLGFMPKFKCQSSKSIMKIILWCIAEGIRRHDRPHEFSFYYIFTFKKREN